MANKAQDSLKFIIQAIENIVTPLVKKLDYDRTYRAKVIKADGDNYTVEINGAEYQVPFKGTLHVGDIVNVRAPLNNFSDIYIECKTESKLDLLNLYYPVGSYYETSDVNFNPNTSWGGVWEEDTKGRVLVARDSGTFNNVGGLIGHERVTLTVAQIPSHRHNLILDGINDGSRTGSSWLVDAGSLGTNKGFVRSTEDAGGGESHSNIQPSIVVVRWHRTE